MSEQIQEVSSSDSSEDMKVEKTTDIKSRTIEVMFEVPESIHAFLEGMRQILGFESIESLLATHLNQLVKNSAEQTMQFVEMSELRDWADEPESYHVKKIRSFDVPYYLRLKK